MHDSSYLCASRMCNDVTQLWALLLQVTVQIDETFKRTGTTVGDFTMLSSRELYVGGTANPSVLAAGAKYTGSFKGCLKKVNII